MTPYNISDHDLINAFITDVKTRHVLTLSPCGPRGDALCLDLLQADWSELYEADSTSDMWNSFLTVCMWDPSINQLMPMRTSKSVSRESCWSVGSL